MIFVIIGAHDQNYALYYLKDTRANNEKTLVSPTIPAGSYCLGFWFYKTGSSSILNVDLNNTSTVLSLWNVTSGPVKQWTLQTVAVHSDDQFQVHVIARYFDNKYDILCEATRT